MTTLPTSRINEQAAVSAVKVPGFKIQFSVNVKSQLMAKSYRLLSSGKNKGQYKLIEGYWFPTEERRQEWAAEKLEGFKKVNAAKENKTTAKAEARANFKNPFTKGQVFYQSWGYDQTNIDFYLILEVKERSVVLTKIGHNVVEGSEGHDCCKITPDTEDHTGASFLKPITIHVSHNGAVTYNISDSHGWLDIYDRGEAGIYTSWGR